MRRSSAVQISLVDLERAVGKSVASTPMAQARLSSLQAGREHRVAKSIAYWTSRMRCASRPDARALPAIWPP